MPIVAAGVPHCMKNESTRPGPAKRHDRRRSLGKQERNQASFMSDRDHTHSSWQADLELSFANCNERTTLIRNRHQGPLQVQKPLYPEGHATCHVAILHPPGGIAATDTLCVRASLADRSRVLLTTPGATKWYRSEGCWPSQQLNFALGNAAVLEWLPRENIFFDGSHISMNLDVELSSHSLFFGWDIYSFGRRASGESWRRGKLHANTRIRRAERILWSEAARVDAPSGFSESAVGLSGFAVCGTFVVAGRGIAADLLARCREVKPTATESRCGITCLPEVLIARYLGHSTEDAFGWFSTLWGVLRHGLLGKIACAPRVWAC
jgi:urease accessory protein